MLEGATINTVQKDNLESYFLRFRKEVIGVDQRINTPLHNSLTMIYADWTASGRCYKAIEYGLINDIMPFMANTHTDANSSSAFISGKYNEARSKIKTHVNAAENDILIAAGAGMTCVVNKLQRIMGLRVPESLRNAVEWPEEDQPVIFITHMEHHSNHTSWLETCGKVVVVPPDEHGNFALENFERLLAEYEHSKLKIAAITACSNVTGICLPIHQIAKIIHRVGGYCFVDFACSAPYVDINMHPRDHEERLDAIYFSTHKFLGGPGSSGILVFNQGLYDNIVPDVSGGGTVDWTNPWGGRRYVEDIEMREDGGTPPILQTIKSAMAIALKEEMGVENIIARENHLMTILWNTLGENPNIKILANEHKNRIGILSFYIPQLHYQTVVKRLNDQFGIQSRGGCSCAGTYGHFLLGIGQQQSKKITDLIDIGDNTQKPGWVRISVHPVMTDKEVAFIAESIKSVADEATL